MKANESKRGRMTEEQAWNDRRTFVHNLGELLAQTRENIFGAELYEDDTVGIMYSSGHVEYINVAMGSYMAIIRDVTRNL